MASNVLEQKNLILTLDVSGLNEQQIRIIKSVNTLLTNVLAADDEGEYFDGTTELMQMVASAVKQANFATDSKAKIAYGVQALEFSLDTLTDTIYTSKTVNFDN